MSLINEALERAREEEARRQSAERGLPLPRHYQSGPRSRSRTPRVLALLILALVISVGVIVMLLLRPRPERMTLARATAETPPAPPLIPEPSGENHATAAVANGRSRDLAAMAAPSPVGPQSPNNAWENNEPDPDVAAGSNPGDPVSSRAEEPTPAQGRSEAPDRGDSEASIPRTEAAEEAPNPTEVVAESLSPTPPTASYLRIAELSNGIRFELGGIAWSESGPFALINGKVVGAREKIEGYRVVAVEPDAVELSGPDGTIRIRLK